MDARTIRNQAGAVEFVGSFFRDWPDLGLPEVAFVGRSNVGKSSALNKLLGRKIARVSGTPGRTQMINLFRIGTAVSFADLPGYGFAKVPEAIRSEWRTMIDGYLGQRDALRMVVVLVDSRLPAQDADIEMIEALEGFEKPTLILATKVDKLTRNQRTKAMKGLLDGFGLEEDDVVPFSGISGEGVDEVWEAIASVCG
jgi:GTP-binding protein